MPLDAFLRCNPNLCDTVECGLLVHMMLPSSGRTSQRSVIQALARLPAGPWVDGVHHNQVMQMKLMQALEAQLTGAVEKEMDATLSAAAMFLSAAKDPQLQQNVVRLAVGSSSRLVDGLKRCKTYDEDSTRNKADLMFLWSQVLKVIIHMLRNPGHACTVCVSNCFAGSHKMYQI